MRKCARLHETLVLHVSLIPRYALLQNLPALHLHCQRCLLCAATILFGCKSIMTICYTPLSQVLVITEHTTSDALRSSTGQPPLLSQRIIPHQLLRTLASRFRAAQWIELIALFSRLHARDLDSLLGCNADKLILCCSIRELQATRNAAACTGKQKPGTTFAVTVIPHVTHIAMRII